MTVSWRCTSSSRSSYLLCIIIFISAFRLSCDLPSFDNQQHHRFATTPQQVPPHPPQHLDISCDDAPLLQALPSGLWIVKSSFCW
jgi:hypothetical protein